MKQVFLVAILVVLQFSLGLTQESPGLQELKNSDYKELVFNKDFTINYDSEVLTKQDRFKDYCLSFIVNYSELSSRLPGLRKDLEKLRSDVEKGSVQNLAKTLKEIDNKTDALNTKDRYILDLLFNEFRNNVDLEILSVNLELDQGEIEQSLEMVSRAHSLLLRDFHSFLQFKITKTREIQQIQTREIQQIQKEKIKKS